MVDNLDLESLARRHDLAAYDDCGRDDHR
jgi:hypothetical protein